jgi:hypothetical protein
MLREQFFAAGALLAFAAGHAAIAHDQPGTHWISKEAAIARVKALGYDAVRLEADDGNWEGEATKAGQFYDIHVDPHSGELTQSRLKH